MMDERERHRRFVALAKWGYPAQQAVASYLYAKGMKVRLPPLRIAPSENCYGEFADDGDVLDEEGDTFEVQRKRRSWDCRHTFPWPMMLACPASKLDRLGDRIRAFFSVSADLYCAAVVPVKEAGRCWRTQDVEDVQVPGRIKSVVMYPLSVVRFVSLKGPVTHFCYECGVANAHLSYDHGETWYCGEHAR